MKINTKQYESFTTLPKDIQYVVDLNFQNNSFQLTLDQMRSALKYIPRDQITAFELGMPLNPAVNACLYPYDNMLKDILGVNR